MCFITETESSYGGGVGPETDSPILLTWQQKPVGLVDTPGGASTSTLDASKSYICLVCSQEILVLLEVKNVLNSYFQIIPANDRHSAD